MDETYKFVRGKPFDGLEEYVYSPEINLKNKMLSYPTPHQLDFDGYSYQVKLKTDLGLYFEILSQGIYGGKLRNQEILGPQLGLFTGKEEFIHPDIVYEPGKYREVKSVARGQTLKLLNAQMKKYASILNNGSHNYQPEINFEIFRHGVQKLLKNFRQKSLEELVKEISSGIRFMISLPPQIVFLIYDESPFTSKYVGDKWDKCSQFLSSGMNSLLAYPNKTLERLGLNPHDFLIQKRKFPGDATMNRTPINPFPILIIKDKNYESWLKNFKDKMQKKENLEENFEELPF